ncbi:DUF3857 domain-containing protein [Marinigracilibium pacificum]|uniref:DUF3857 and transglutaminase domain-containing protein n=1 Tax=Marinigracilibium pacificum TaxID=2729599 RepID=A0A848J1H0_9BACT|nr:DUF3857 domain-containing protein [Marinigracilibium pacificum]NMM48390.1 DUF3857 and transglutaminase domain-containing protein [Marinigracilibium pacificum]
MQRFLIFIISFLCIQLYGYSNYDRKVNASISMHEKVVVNNDGSFYVETTREVKVLNRHGVKYAQGFFRYGDLYEVEGIEGEVIYNGKSQKIKNRDFFDVSADHGGDISGERILFYEPALPTYPYTVRFSYTIKCNSLYFLSGLGAWSPLSYEDVKVSKHEYEFYKNHNYDIDFKLNGDRNLYTVNESPQKVHITMENYIADKEKKLYVPGLDQNPQFIPLPKEFVFEGTTVNMYTWQDYGNWYYKLNKGRDELTEEFTNKINELIKNVDSDIEKVNILYKYLQNNTRYVSIQLGIGGWQSMPAKMVAEKGYGDCKGLSSLMKGMLKVAGIESNYVLVGATYNKMYQEFDEDNPNNNFNHVFLVVPMENDSLWLECTSSNTNINYEGFHTGNRKALFVKENDSQLINTPKFTYEENSEELKIFFDISNTEQRFDIMTTLKGNQAYLMNLNNDYYTEINEHKVRFRRRLPFQVSKLEGFEIENVGEYNPEFNIKMNGISSGLMVSAGSNRIIRPLLICKLDERYKVDEGYSRKFHIGTRKQEIANVIIKLPEGYTLAEIPENESLACAAGTYEVKYELKNGELHIFRKVRFSGDVFEPSEVDVVNNFYNQVHKSDNKSLILVNNGKS